VRLFGASVAARRRTSREQSCMACVQVFFFERLACVQTSCRAVFVFPAHGYTTTALFSGPYLAACRVCARLLYAHERCTYADGEISDLAIRGSFSSEYKRHTPDLYLCLSSRTVVPLQYTRGPATRCTGSSVLLRTDLQSVPRMSSA